MYSEYIYTKDKFEHALYDIRANLFKTQRGDDCAGMIAPLERYAQSSNASVDFLTALCYANARQKSTIAKKLAQGGSDAEVIARLKTYLKTK